MTCDFYPSRSAMRDALAQVAPNAPSQIMVCCPQVIEMTSEPGGIRTRDPLIKSQGPTRRRGNAWRTQREHQGDMVGRRRSRCATEAQVALMPPHGTSETTRRLIERIGDE